MASFPPKSLGMCVLPSYLCLLLKRTLQGVELLLAGGFKDFFYFFIFTPTSGSNLTNILQTETTN